jgi:hypothetical protein
VILTGHTSFAPAAWRNHDSQLVSIIIIIPSLIYSFYMFFKALDSLAWTQRIILCGDMHLPVPEWFIKKRLCQLRWSGSKNRLTSIGLVCVAVSSKKNSKVSNTGLESPRRQRLSPSVGWSVETRLPVYISLGTCRLAKVERSWRAWISNFAYKSLLGSRRTNNKWYPAGFVHVLYD